VPVLALIAVYLLLISPLNDNHAVRRLDGPTAQRPGLDGAFTRWNAAGKARAELGGSPERHPLIVVATEGGGVRAAYWTAILLRPIAGGSAQFPRSPVRDQRCLRRFAWRGGIRPAAGARPSAVKCTTAPRFEGLDAASPLGPNPAPLVKCARDVLSHDFLAATIGAFLYPDLVQRFLPFTLLPDRAAAIERAWEIGWDKSVPAYAGRFAEPLVPFLANAGAARRPVLLLNGTSVQHRPASDHQQHRRRRRHLPRRDRFPRGVSRASVRVSTAANNSARFPYIEPGGAYCGKECGWITLSMAAISRISGPPPRGSDRAYRTQIARPEARVDRHRDQQRPRSRRLQIRRVRPGVSS